MQKAVNPQPESPEFLTLRQSTLISNEYLPFPGNGMFFAFLIRGKGNCLLGQISVNLSAGDMLVSLGPERSKLFVESESEMTFAYFCLRIEHIFPLFESLEISSLQTVIDKLKAAKVYSRTESISMRCKAWIAEVPKKHNLDHRSQLLRSASAVLSEEFDAAHSERTNDGGMELRILAVIEKLPSDQLLNLSVGELAAKFGCSRRHLNRLFHEYFGHSVASLRMELRLLKSICLLRDVNSKIINVAESCGFNHLGLFNNCFKRRFGVTPGVWRKQERIQRLEPVDSKIQPHSGSSLMQQGLYPAPNDAQDGSNLAFLSPLLRNPKGEKVLPLLVAASSLKRQADKSVK